MCNQKLLIKIMLFIFANLFFCTAFAADSSTLMRTPAERQKTTGRTARALNDKQVDIMYWFQGVNHNSKVSCPPGTSFIEGKNIHPPGTSGSVYQYFIRCATNYSSGDKTMTDFIAQAKSGFVRCPVYPQGYTTIPGTGRRQVRCSTLYKTPPLTTIYTPNCAWPPTYTWWRPEKDKKPAYYARYCAGGERLAFRNTDGNWFIRQLDYVYQPTFTALLLPGTYYMYADWKNNWSVRCWPGWGFIRVQPEHIGKTCEIACNSDGVPPGLDPAIHWRSYQAGNWHMWVRTFDWQPIGWINYKLRNCR